MDPLMHGRADAATTPDASDAAAGAGDAGLAHPPVASGARGAAIDGVTERVALRADLLRDLLLMPHGSLTRVEVLARVESTNTELARLVALGDGRWTAPALLVADHQEAGRGRLDRAWQTPAHTALTCSLLVRPEVPVERWTWLPLLAGLAAVRAVRAMTGLEAGLKWPNDLLVPTPDGTDLYGWGVYRKFGGILTESLGDGHVIVGLGINVSQHAHELPVSSATSLELAGAQGPERELLLTALQEAFAEIMDRWYDAGGDADAAGLREEVADILITIGHDIRADMPGGREARGVARGLNADGALVLDAPDGGQSVVLSGDVHHVRLAEEK